MNQQAEALQALKDLVDECYEDSLRIDRMQEEVDAEKKKLSQKEQGIGELLDAAEIDTFVGTHCQYAFKETDGITGPESDEDWSEFRKYYKEQNPAGYESAFKMHIGSCKAWLRKQFAILIAEGLEPVIPGIPTPKPGRYLKMTERKKK